MLFFVRFHPRYRLCTTWLLNHLPCSHWLEVSSSQSCIRKRFIIMVALRPASPLSDRRKATQKRTFTRWMNVFLQKVRREPRDFHFTALFTIKNDYLLLSVYFQRNPPLAVSDLFTDIQDGRMLMALLEELSGCKLVRTPSYFSSQSHKKKKKSILLE